MIKIQKSTKKPTIKDVIKHSNLGRFLKIMLAAMIVNTPTIKLDTEAGILKISEILRKSASEKDNPRLDKLIILIPKANRSIPPKKIPNLLNLIP